MRAKKMKSKNIKRKQTTEILFSAIVNMMSD